jgi:hypothetical protein
VVLRGGKKKVKKKKKAKGSEHVSHEDAGTTKRRSDANRLLGVQRIAKQSDLDKVQKKMEQVDPQLAQDLARTTAMSMARMHKVVSKTSARPDRGFYANRRMVGALEKRYRNAHVFSAPPSRGMPKDPEAYGRGIAFSWIQREILYPPPDDVAKGGGANQQKAQSNAPPGRGPGMGPQMGPGAGPGAGPGMGMGGRMGPPGKDPNAEKKEDKDPRGKPEDLYVEQPPKRSLTDIAPRSDALRKPHPRAAGFSVEMVDSRKFEAGNAPDDFWKALAASCSIHRGGAFLVAILVEEHGEDAEGDGDAEAKAEPVRYWGCRDDGKVFTAIEPCVGEYRFPYKKVEAGNPPPLFVKLFGEVARDLYGAEKLKGYTVFKVERKKPGAPKVIGADSKKSGD